MVRFLLALLFLAPLASCTTVSEEECRGGDWQAIGFQDGVDGRDTRFVENHTKACASVGVAPDIAEWEQGREEGLVVYCTPLRNYLLGRRGIVAKEICPAELQAMLTSENRRGLNAKLAIEERRRYRFNAMPINPGLLRLPPPVLDLGNGRTEYAVLNDELSRVRNEELLWF